VIDRAILETAAKAIADSDTLALACHIGPDGDALGSMLGFGVAAETAGKKVVASFGTPFAVSASLAFLPTRLLIPPQEFPPDPPMMVVFDAGSLDRLGELAENASRAATTIVLDHHITNDGFGDIAVVDGEAAATGELVARLLEIVLDGEVLAWMADRPAPFNLLQQRIARKTLTKR
jgi:phosphoesterase RecJ-like protein